MTPQAKAVTPNNFLIFTVVLFLVLLMLAPETLVLMVPALLCSAMVSATMPTPRVFVRDYNIDKTNQKQPWKLAH